MIDGILDDFTGRGPASLALGAALVLVLAGGPSDRDRTRTVAVSGVYEAGACAVMSDTLSNPMTAASDFYEIPLVPTGKVPGTGSFTGKAAVSFKDGPFDVAVSNDGTFHRRLRIDMTGLKPAEKGDYVVWASPPNLEPVMKLGSLGEDMKLTGEVAFPKFLVIVSYEENPEEIEGRWSGPIVHRGMSRSGFMHSMAGHGPFSGDPCASYGFQ